MNYVSIPSWLQKWQASGQQGPVTVLAGGRTITLLPFRAIEDERRLLDGQEVAPILMFSGRRTLPAEEVVRIVEEWLLVWPDVARDCLSLVREEYDRAIVELAAKMPKDRADGYLAEKSLPLA